MSSTLEKFDVHLKGELEKPSRNIQGSVINTLDSFFKRAMDVFFSALGLLLLSPVLVYIARRIQKEDPGPALYKGPRVGKNGKVFEIYKFRTMFENDASYNGHRITARGDQRITNFGRWLRASKVNELPQLWNVLKGDMSLVGPRPEDPEIFFSLPEDYQAEITSVRPGITSPASVTYADEETRLNADDPLGDYLKIILPDKMRMDRLYVKHHNILRDLDTIFWTLILFFPRLNHQTRKEGDLFYGPISLFFNRYFNWFVIDTLTSLAGIALVGVVWRAIAELNIGFPIALLMGLVLAFAFGLVNTVLGLKIVNWQKATASDVLKLIASCLFVGLLYTGYLRLFPIGPRLPSIFVIAVCVTSSIGFVVTRYRARLITGLATRWLRLRKGSIGSGERVLIIGAGHAGEFAAWMLKSPDFRNYYEVVGFVDDNPDIQGMKHEGIRVLGTTTDIPTLAVKHKIGLLFFSINNIPKREKTRILNTCKKSNMPVVFANEVIKDVRVRFAESFRSED